MTAAYRLRGLGWFASCAAIVLGFYLVSLQVASERNKLEALNRRIASAERDIRALETEFDTRANMQQLEKWNGDILALSAPVAGQFVTSEAQLAAARFGGQPLAGEGGEVKTAALVVPALYELPAPVAPTPAPAAPVQIAAQAATPAPASKPAAPAKRASVAATAVAAVKASVAPTARAAKPQKVAMLDGDFLSDLAASARAEAARR